MAMTMPPPTGAPYMTPAPMGMQPYGPAPCGPMGQPGMGPMGQPGMGPMGQPGMMPPAFGGPGMMPPAPGAPGMMPPAPGGPCMMPAAPGGPCMMSPAAGPRGYEGMYPEIRAPDGRVLTEEEIRSMSKEDFDKLFLANREMALKKQIEGELHSHHATIPEGIEELKLVKAWRPTATGSMELATGVIHRVHHEDRTVTVQFVPDQHRCRVAVSSIKPMSDVTPNYQKIYLKPGERMPTPSEYEAKQAFYAQELPDGVEQERPERLQERVRQWGIPAQTLEALRNRSIPTYQVTGEYGRHFYTELYRNNFYHRDSDEFTVSASGHVGVDEDGRHGLSLHAGRASAMAGAGGSTGGNSAALRFAGAGGGGAGAGGFGGGAAGGYAGAGGFGGGAAGGCGGGFGGGPGGDAGGRGGGFGGGPGGGFGPGRGPGGGFGPGGGLGGGRGGGAGGGLFGGMGGGGRVNPLHAADLGENGIVSGAGGLGGHVHGSDLLDPTRTRGHMPDGSKVISHHYVPLEGNELEQDLNTGRWYPLDAWEMSTSQQDGGWQGF